ncbi:CapA family protein [Rhizobium sp. WYJ-E13]|uniref:CapA family protein n=1 Tax=Rhizobium sp. WYJ-E13 TaxID=2849093 RepID=UPI0034652AE9
MTASPTILPLSTGSRKWRSPAPSLPVPAGSDEASRWTPATCRGISRRLPRRRRRDPSSLAYLHHHHWAADWYQVPDWVSSVAKRCIDAGTAMFVSHGAPVLQPLEIYRRRPIFYSLGNFIFHVRSEKSAWTAPEVWESVVSLCSFAENGDLLGATFPQWSLAGVKD